METKDLIKYGAVIVGGYLIYEWLQSSGLWAQWFGGTAAVPANQFTSGAALITYCQANPGGTAVYVDASGVAHSASCASWIATNGASGSELPVTTSQVPTNYQQAVALMTAAAGNDLQDLDNWAYYWQNGTQFTGSPAGFGVPGSISPTQMDQIVGLAGGDRSSPVQAEQFVAWLQQSAAAGMAGLMCLDMMPSQVWVN